MYDLGDKSIRKWQALARDTDRQDEAAVFLLVGATFLSGAYVQSQRSHIGIEALDMSMVGIQLLLHLLARLRKLLPLEGEES